MIVLAAFVFSCGGQWYAAQGIAWIKMIHDYSQVVPFTDAVCMTLSGHYPCAICKAIAEKKQSENLALCSIEKYEKKFFPPVSVAPVDPPAVVLEYADHTHFLRVRTEPPLTPPPRSILS